MKSKSNLLMRERCRYEEREMAQGRRAPPTSREALAGARAVALAILADGRLSGPEIELIASGAVEKELGLPKGSFFGLLCSFGAWIGSRAASRRGRVELTAELADEVLSKVRTERARIGTLRMIAKTAALGRGGSWEEAWLARRAVRLWGAAPPA